MNAEINEARAVLDFAEDALSQFEAGVDSTIRALAVTRNDGTIAQLTYFAAGRKAARKLVADAKAKLAAAEGRYGRGRP